MRNRSAYSFRTFWCAFNDSCCQNTRWKKPGRRMKLLPIRVCVKVRESERNLRHYLCNASLSTSFPINVSLEASWQSNSIKKVRIRHCRTYRTPIDKQEKLVGSPNAKRWSDKTHSIDVAKRTPHWWLFVFAFIFVRRSIRGRIDSLTHGRCAQQSTKTKINDTKCSCLPNARTFSDLFRLWVAPLHF